MNDGTRRSGSSRGEGVGGSGRGGEGAGGLAVNEATFSRTNRRPVDESAGLPPRPAGRWLGLNGGAVSKQVAREAVRGDDGRSDRSISSSIRSSSSDGEAWRPSASYSEGKAGGGRTGGGSTGLELQGTPATLSTDWVTGADSGKDSALNGGYGTSGGFAEPASSPPATPGAEVARRGLTLADRDLIFGSSSGVSTRGH